MVEIAIHDRGPTVVHLREMAARCRQLALVTWDKDVVEILNETSHDYDDEAEAMEYWKDK